MSCEFRKHDAAYVLGALPAGERQAYEEHLDSCAECARAVRELAGMPGLLARLDLDTVENPTPPPPLPATLLPELVREVRRTQRRRRGVLLAGATAAVAAAVAGVLALGPVLGTPDTTAGDRPTVIVSVTPSAPPVPTPSATVGAAPGRAMTQVGQNQLRARVAMDDVKWGTRLDLTCRYRGDHVYPGSVAPTYALVVLTRDGHSEQVATWRAVPDGTMSLSAATASASADIASVEVRTMSGRPVLRLAS